MATWKEVNEVMEGIQTLVISEHPSAQRHLEMVTPMMLAVRKYFLEKRMPEEEDQFKQEEMIMEKHV